jgi:choline/glycine/proline betaine transport protein
VGFSAINLFNKEKIPGEKEFSNSHYFFLLFTLGMGVGIMVYAFNEVPSLSQYSDVRNPFGLCLNHWTIVPWSIYTTFTIFEVYDLKYKLLPNWLRTIKNYLYGLMMMLGIGTSFALGVITIANSIKILYGVEVPSYALVILLGSCVTISLLRGLHKGMEMFATFSMYMLFGFIIILAIIAPSDSLQVIITSTGSLIKDFIYNNIYRGSAVQNDWTVFYWIWWIGWAAFCAPFIIRISKGRSIRSVVFFTVVIPTILIILFMSLGNNFGMHLLKSGTEIANIPYAAINVHWLLPLYFIVLMSLFYITSSDSQSFAMDSIISKGSSTPIVYRKILWVFLEVLFVTVLLLAGSGTTSAVQGISFLGAIPMILFAGIFTVLIIKFYITKKIKK